MALTVTSLAAALRAGDGTAAPAEPFAGILARLLEVGTAMVEKLAPDAPEAVADEAVVRFAGYLYDAPESPPGAAYAAAWRNSGAQSLVAPWVARRAVSVEAAAAAAASTSSTSTGGPGVDETARAAAAEARTIADANAAKLMPAPPAEADAATATTIRGWTAAAVRRVVEAIVPAWARATDPPSGGSSGSPSGDPARFSPRPVARETETPAQDGGFAAATYRVANDEDLFVVGLFAGAAGTRLTMTALLPRVLLPGSGPPGVVFGVDTRNADMGNLNLDASNVGVSAWLVGSVLHLAIPSQWTACRINSLTAYRITGAQVSGETTLPAYEQAEEQGLFSRAGSLFWRLLNEVPDTPGTSSAVGHALTVTGENDRDYAWRAIADATARANAATNAGNITALETTVNNDRLSLAALETALPDPAVPAAEAADRTYALQVPGGRGRARWVLAGGAATDQAARDAVTAEAMTRASADTALGARIDTEATTRASADTALGVRIDALTAPIADPVFEPAYWTKTRDAHTLIVHLDPATLVTEVASIRVVVAGVGVNVSKVADQDVYAFVFDAANSATITASAGNAGRDTVTAEVILRDASSAEVRRWRIVLRVLDAAPSAGAGVETLASGAYSATVRLRVRNLTAADDHKAVTIEFNRPVSDSTPAPIFACALVCSGAQMRSMQSQNAGVIPFIYPNSSAAAIACSLQLGGGAWVMGANEGAGVIEANFTYRLQLTG